MANFWSTCSPWPFPCASAFRPATLFIYLATKTKAMQLALQFPTGRVPHEPAPHHFRPANAIEYGAAQQPAGRRPRRPAGTLLPRESPPSCSARRRPPGPHHPGGLRHQHFEHAYQIASSFHTPDTYRGPDHRSAAIGRRFFSPSHRARWRRRPAAKRRARAGHPRNASLRSGGATGTLERGPVRPACRWDAPETLNLSLTAKIGLQRSAPRRFIEIAGIDLQTDQLGLL